MTTIPTVLYSRSRSDETSHVPFWTAAERRVGCQPKVAKAQGRPLLLLALSPLHRN